MAVLEILAYVFAGSATRALFGIYCSWKNKGWINIDWKRLGIEFISAAFFGYISSWLLAGFWKGFGEAGIAFIGGLMGADLLNKLAKHVGVTKGFQLAIEKVPAYKGFNMNQRRALEYAAAAGISNNEYQRINIVSDSTAQRDLKALVKKGFLRVEGKDKKKRYIL